MASRGEQSRKTQQEQLEQLMQRFQEVNEYFIWKVARQIRAIGELSPSSAHIIAVMAAMTEDIADINRRLARALELAIGDLYRLYEDVLNDTYHDPRFERALHETPLSDLDKRRLEHYAQVISRQTAGTMQNLSNTTAISQTYRGSVDKAILAVSSGMTDYKAATRKSVRELGHSGIQILYDSGYHRRLDTAIRQNVLDGANQLAQNASIMMGEQLGYDAYEISAHAHSAPDHEPVQGRVFLKDEFAKMQNGEPFADTDGNHYDGFRRPIGEWNCMHIVMSFSTRYSKRRYSNEQLQSWKRENAKGCDVDGKHMSLYEASQYMRKIETDTRREKDAAIAAQAAGDSDLREQCQKRIDSLADTYTMVAKASGLTPRRDRMRVEGFRRMKR